MPAASAADELVEILDSRFFKALSEPVRIQIMKFLIINGRSDIGTIADAMPQDRSVVSRHLQFMQTTGILKSEKITRHVFYEINGREIYAKLAAMLANIRACMPACCPGDEG
ncbi:MAG: winged helix-turn-helix domain-containing protein [Desulfobacterales bacterium]|nr:winged helix-turn-helix domain-containing protein [Desulfobacterales bacterium]